MYTAFQTFRPKQRRRRRRAGETEMEDAAVTEEPDRRHSAMTPG